MKVSYKLQDKFDLVIFIPVIFLVIIGLMAIFSATYNQSLASGNFQKQLIAAVFSVLILLIVYFLPPVSLRELALPSYLLSIFFLIVVLVLGRTVYGSKSWLNFGPLGFQPSEFAKVGVVLFMSHWLTNKKDDINNVKDIGVALLIGFLPVALILLEPDMGTAIVFVIITISILFWSGISLFAMFVVLSPAIVIFASLLGTFFFILSLAFVVICLVFFKRDLFNSITIFVANLASSYFFSYIYKILKPHQQKRIETFLNPNADPLGSGYNAIQAKVAIGSGGIFGKGYLQGNQTQLRFIPEQWTDFIYCVIGEEFGFIGSIVIIILFLILFLRLLKLASNAKDKYHALIIIGVLSIIFSHFAINIGMNVGVTPVIGLPLPFLSYGGSSLMVNMILIGIVLNIYRNRKMYT
ncbi:rod shape-determining protein RodA [Melioribacteraceae bacterium 4301-Me]|uniref:rod shape-determining protein RodA n=1 Tax=Pyranulibacter aquaticus TaxID=3163344 RepID=UPI003599D410